MTAIPRSGAWMIAMMLTVTGAGTASGQDYPVRPIRMMAPTAGGGTDFAARIVAQGLSTALGQQVIVENRSAAVHGTWLPGASPDGYNILIDLAKAKPGDINYSSSSSGGSAHLAAELFASLAGVKLVRIGHKGAGEALVSLLTGQGVHLAFISIASVVPHIKAGRLRGLGVTGVKPSNALPGLPPVAETVPGYQSGGQTALFAPPKTPAAIISRLNRDAVRYLNTPEIRERFANSGVDVIASAPEELRVFIKSEIVKWDRVIKDAGIKLDN